MTISKTASIGRKGERAVADLFNDWLWGVGTDELDVGYDLMVEPDRERYLGARFLVQVKSTQTTGAQHPTASVRKDRLRAYAINPHAVFIVRRLADGTLLWVHAQEWCRENLQYITGKGTVSVSFDPANKLTDRDSFETYLRRVIQRSPAQATRDRELRLLALDPRLNVEITATSAGEQYSISATDTPVSATCEIKLTPESANASRTQLTLLEKYGVPAQVDVDSFSLTGSPVFEDIGAHNAKGTIALTSTKSYPAEVSIYAGQHATFLTPVIHLKSTLFAGSEGASLVPDKEDLVKFTWRFDWPKPGANNSPGHFDICLDTKILGQASLKLHTQLEKFVDWVDSALQHSDLQLTVDGATGRISAPIPITEEIELLLKRVQFLGKAHQVARYFASQLTIAEGASVSTDDMTTVNMAYRALRGESVEIVLPEIPVDRPVSDIIPSNGLFLITTQLRLDVFGQHLGNLDSVIELHEYEVVRNDQGLVTALRTGPESVARLRHRAFSNFKIPSDTDS